MADNTQTTDEPSRKRLPLFTISLIFIAGFASYGGMNQFFAYTNSMEFCTSCHSMKTNFEEYKETIHYSNRSGVQATCSDCHVPQQFLPKVAAKIVAAKDVWHELIGTVDTPEKFEQHRWNMANRVWDKMRATNSRECRNCHDFNSMNSEAQSGLAARKHANAVEDGQTCIDCHTGIAHEEPMEP